MLVTSYHPESGWLSIDRALAELADVSHRPEKNTCVRGAVKDLCPEAVVITQIEGRMVRVLRKETNAATTLFLECLPYVCPEPVLVKRWFLDKNGIAKVAFLYQPAGGRVQLQRGVERRTVEHLRMDNGGRPVLSAFPVFEVFVLSLSW